MLEQLLQMNVHRALRYGKYLPESLKYAAGNAFSKLQQFRGENYVEVTWEGHHLRFGYWDRVTLGVANRAITDGMIGHEMVPIGALRVNNSRDAILDIGAHMGIYTVILACLNTEQQIHAFEPDSYNVNTLRKNISLNDFEEHRIDVHQAVVSNSSGTIDFYTDPSAIGTTSHTVQPTDSHSSHTRHSINSIKGSKFCSEHEIVKPWVKIDAEGVELQILQDLLNSDEIESVAGFVELHLNRKNVSREKFRQILENHDYEYDEIKNKLEDTNPGYLIEPK
ncbi:FkbM family methyltransferase [Halovenus halobia]|uniref:FkbM family methyltransferase n=1 Tax=Halovenus halobia TaxID=3396622 RepID=UPI003F54E1F1